MENHYTEIMQNENTYDTTFKLILIGDSGTGKSCLAQQAVKSIFEENYNCTLGFEYSVLCVKVDDKIIKLQIWDTCGQETYKSLITNFYRTSSLAFLIYSIDSVESFKNLDYWLKDLRKFSNPDIKVILVGTKCDLEELRVVSYEEGKQFACENGIEIFFEASAKTGDNVKRIFIQAAIILYKEFPEIKQSNFIEDEKLHSESSMIQSLSIRIDDAKKSKKKKCSC